jgi:hypothetical protein
MRLPRFVTLRSQRQARGERERKEKTRFPIKTFGNDRHDKVSLHPSVLSLS